MFAPKGYTPLATLWSDFERQYIGWSHHRACAHFQAHGFDTNTLFGSPLDLCEDLFLTSLSDVALTLFTPSSDLIGAPSTLPNSNASIFTKTTVYESMVIVADPDEAGLESEWLAQMGSTRFGFWPHMEADYATWGAQYCSGARAKTEGNGADTLQFYTLPYCFERGTYMVPKELPPWTIDMIDGSFARSLSGSLLGSSICLGDKVANKWRRRVTEDQLEQLFMQLMGARDANTAAELTPKVGRPNKRIAAAQAYVDLGLIDSQAPWKEKRILVEDHLKSRIGLTTLKNAARLAKQKLTSKK